MDWMLVGCIGSEIRIRTGIAIESRRNIRKPEVRQESKLKKQNKFRESVSEVKFSTIGDEIVSHAILVRVVINTPTTNDSEVQTSRHC